LEDVYSKQTDGELAAVAGQGDELTDVARDTLRAELVKRGLYSGQLEEVPTETEDRTEFRDLVTVRTFSSLPEAELAMGLLESAGIESFLFDSNMARIYWMNAVDGVKLRVDAHSVEEASRILNANAESGAALDQSELPEDDA